MICEICGKQYEISDNWKSKRFCCEDCKRKQHNLNTKKFYRQRMAALREVADEDYDDQSILIPVEGCIFPACNEGINCPLKEPPEKCTCDLTALERANYWDEIKVKEGKAAAYRIAARNEKERNRQWYAEHRDTRNKYMRDRYKKTNTG